MSRPAPPLSCGGRVRGYGCRTTKPGHDRRTMQVGKCMLFHARDTSSSSVRSRGLLCSVSFRAGTDLSLRLCTMWMCHCSACQSKPWLRTLPAPLLRASWQHWQLHAFTTSQRVPVAGDRASPGWQGNGGGTPRPLHRGPSSGESGEPHRTAIQRLTKSSQIARLLVAPFKKFSRSTC